MTPEEPYFPSFYCFMFDLDLLSAKTFYKYALGTFFCDPLGFAAKLLSKYIFVSYSSDVSLAYKVSESVIIILILLYFLLHCERKLCHC